MEYVSMRSFSQSLVTTSLVLSLFSSGAGLFALAGRSDVSWKNSWHHAAADEHNRQSATGAELTLRTYLESLKGGRPFDLEEATNQVFRGTEHSDQRKIHFSENWIQWLVGQGYAPLMHTQDTGLLIAGGQANCSERAQILKTLAETAGKSCRFVGLNGHVVLEVEDQGIWKMADPDYGIAYTSGVQVLSQPAAAPLVRKSLLQRGYPSLKVEKYLEILQSSGDNIFLPHGQALSPRLFALESACRWLVWVLPSVFLLAGLAIGSLAWYRDFFANRQVPAVMNKRRSRLLRPTQLEGILN
jgi:hypothetical protein